VLLVAAAVLGTVGISGTAEVFELFDGKSFQGWTTLDGEPVTGGWEVVNRVIHRRPTADGERAGHIWTDREFGDFRLTFEWKIASGGNSGIKYRVRDYDVGIRGCEYQIIDDSVYRHRLSPRNLTGSIYDMYEPIAEVPIRANDFQATTIIVQNDHIEHWQNGILIVEAHVGDDQWNSRWATSKFNDLPEFGRNQRGRIMLTDHGSEVWYRNFCFELLPTDEVSSP
jgi:hypothetical protein